MAPKSVTFRRHDHLVSVLFLRFAQPFLQHYIFNVFGSCLYRIGRGCNAHAHCKLLAGNTNNKTLVQNTEKKLTRLEVMTMMMRV